jgi:hypothetical protein
MSYYISILLGHMESGMLFSWSFNFIPFVILFPGYRASTVACVDNSYRLLTIVYNGIINHLVKVVER